MGFAHREGAQRPQLVKGKGPENPGVAAPLAPAGCRGNFWRVVDGLRGETVLRVFYVLVVIGHNCCADYGEDCASVLRGSGARMLFADCYPFRAYITHATDVLIVPYAPRRRAKKVSNSRSSCLRSTSLFPQRVSSLWTTRSSRRTTRSLETLVTLAMRSTWTGSEGLEGTEVDYIKPQSFKIHNTCMVLHRCFPDFPVFPDLPDFSDFSECWGHPAGGKSTLRAQVILVPGQCRTENPR